MKKHNVIWVVLDGVRNYPTPNDPEKMGKPELIDDIASDGVEFLQATTSGTSTLMAVSAMMTSVPAYYLSRNLDDLHLDKSNFESIGMILEDVGYSVYNVCISYEMRREYWKEFLRPMDKSYWPKGCKAMLHWNNEPLNPIIFKLLNEGIKEPFFLYVHYNARRDADCANKARVMLDKLKEHNLYDESIMVICSDHGMPDEEKRNFFKWLEERGLYFNRHDLIMTDDNILVPLVIKYPGCPIGKKHNTTVGLIDVVPTILDLIGVEHGKGKLYGKSFRGVSLLPLINGLNDENYKNRKIRTDARYIAQTDRLISIRGTGYKYVYFRDMPVDEKEQFFDLSKDELEEKNLINSEDPFYKEKIREFKSEFERQEQDAVDFHKEFLARKFNRYVKNNLNAESEIKIKKVIFIGSCNYSFFSLAISVFKSAFNNPAIDLLIERTNLYDEKRLNHLGLRNIIFVHRDFDYKQFKRDLKDVFEEYDLIIIPVTSYKKDIEQSKNKSTEGKVEMIQPQSPISNRIVKDLKEVFKISKIIKAPKRIYIDYNMNIYKRPRLIQYNRFLRKMIAKRDIYWGRSSELIKDIKRLFNK